MDWRHKINAYAVFTRMFMSNHARVHGRPYPGDFRQATRDRELKQRWRDLTFQQKEWLKERASDEKRGIRVDDTFYLPFLFPPSLIYQNRSSFAGASRFGTLDDSKVAVAAKPFVEYHFCPLAIVEEDLVAVRRGSPQEEQFDYEKWADYFEKSEKTVVETLLQCGTCFEDCAFDNMVACSEGHLFCVVCLRRHVQQTMFGQVGTDIICMEDECKARFFQEMLVKALDSKTLEKLDEWRTNGALTTADLKGLEKCKYCFYAVIFELPPQIDNEFICQNPKCGKEYCRICGASLDDHCGLACDEIEKDDDDQKRCDAEERMAAAMIRRCNKCKTPMIKEEGCNKLACYCGEIMCYVCRESISGYDHFCPHVRDPGQPCSSCSKCFLWEDTDKKDNVTVRSIQLEANKGFAEVGKKVKVGTETL